MNILAAKTGLDEFKKRKTEKHTKMGGFGDS